MRTLEIIVEREKSTVASKNLQIKSNNKTIGKENKKNEAASTNNMGTTNHQGSDKRTMSILPEDESEERHDHLDMNA